MLPGSLSDIGVCNLCGRDEAYHRHLYESTDQMDPMVAEEHARMIIARDEYQIEQARKRIETSCRDLERLHILTQSRRARALHELANIARRAGVLVLYTPGVSVVTRASLFDSPVCEIACKPFGREPSFYANPVTMAPTIERERFRANPVREIIDGNPVGELFVEYRASE